MYEQIVCWKWTHHLGYYLGARKICRKVPAGDPSFVPFVQNRVWFLRATIETGHKCQTAPNHHGLVYFLRQTQAVNTQQSKTRQACHGGEKSWQLLQDPWNIAAFP